MKNKILNDEDKNSGYFNEMSKSWDQNSMRNQIAVSVVRSIHKYIPMPKNTVMMDFGCGTGLVSFFFYPHIAQIDGFDTSAGMVDEFNKKSQSQNYENAHAIVYDPDNGTLPEEKYNVIISSMVFHHIPDPGNLLKKLYGSLKNGGCLAIADLDEEDGSFHPSEAEGVHHHGFSRERMKSWFIESGFQEVTISTVMQLDKDDRKYSIFLCTGKK